MPFAARDRGRAAPPRNRGDDGRRGCRSRTRRRRRRRPLLRGRRGRARRRRVQRFSSEGSSRFLEWRVDPLRGQPSFEVAAPTVESSGDAASTMAPSRIARRRGARAARPASWVATMIVVPRWRRGPRAGRSRRRRSSCRGCRSARRRGSRAARRRARARSRRAAARRPRAARAGARRGRRVRPRRAGRASARRARRRRRRSARARPRRSGRAVSVGIRLNCWKTKPKARSRSSASSLSRSVARSRPSKKTWPLARAVERAEELEQGRLARAARPLERDELAGVDRRSTPSTARTSAAALREHPRRVLDVVQRRVHYSTVLSASAGRSRAARNAPAAPASRPPDEREHEADEQHADARSAR